MLDSQVPTPSDPAPSEFRWQAFFQKSDEPLFLLSRQRRVLFVNRAWERLTGIALLQVRGLSCAGRGSPSQEVPQSILDGMNPPPEALIGKAVWARRCVVQDDNTKRSWDIDFFPLLEANRLLGVIGRIRPGVAAAAPEAVLLPEKLMAIRERVARRYTFAELDSTACAMRQVASQARLGASIWEPVLILGEPGTGKNWLARTLHHQGVTREGPFVGLDCSRLPIRALARVLEASGLFLNSRHPRMLYLSEPQFLPRDLQSRLLDLIGAAVESRLRILAGSSADLKKEVGEGRFLEELHSALGVLSIALPPLRDRGADLRIWIERLVERFSEANASGPKEVTRAVIELAASYRWPGNLTELHSVLRSVCHGAGAGPIAETHFPAAIRRAKALDRIAASPPERSLPLDPLLEEVERRLIGLALKQSAGNRSRAATQLGIWRARLLRRMEALNIAGPAKPDPSETESSDSLS